MQARFLSVFLLLLGACASAGGRTGSPDSFVAPELDAAVQDAPAGEQKSAKLDSRWPPGPTAEQKGDWVCLKSGEWLRGEFLSLNRGNVEFDSDELDRLNLDWDDILEVVTDRTFTAVLGDRTNVIGRPRITPERMYVTNRFGVFEYPRTRLMRLIPGHADEEAVWSGELGINFTARAGNTEQVDFGVIGDAKRRTANARTSMSVNTLVTSTDDSQTANNKSLSVRHDVYLSPKFFLTPLGVDLYRDRFQNLALRATPSSGIGYTFVEDGKLEWDGTASLGYRYTRYDSVGAGEDDSDGSGTLILGTAVLADVTPKIELGFDYRIEIGLEDLDDTDHDLGLLLSLEFMWGLDLDVRFSWKRIGLPEEDANQVTPEPDDYRLDVGFSWEF